jgi:photosystem II stability/assembly factor-like uncharacterized protein
MKISSLTLAFGSVAMLPIFSMAQFHKVAAIDTSYISCLVTDSSNCFAASYTGGLYKSSDDGAGWTLLDRNLAREKGLLSLAIAGASIYAGTSGSGVYRSDDGGENWTPLNQGLFLPIEVMSLACTDSSIIAGTYGQGIYKCRRGDDQWLAADAPGLILSVTARGSTIFAASVGPVVYRSTDNGLNWTPLGSGLEQQCVTAVAFDGQVVYAATVPQVYTTVFGQTTQGPGVFVSLDSGVTWSSASTGMNNERVYCLTLNDRGAASPFALAGLIGGGVYLSTNSGVSWQFVGDGLPSETVNAMTIVSSYVIVGTYDGSIWRRPLSEIITGFNPRPGDLPRDFELCQNYPNPFNPTTAVRFSLPKAAFSELSVWNMLGQKLATLVSQRLSAGTHTYRWDASKFASGVYFFRLQAGDFLEMKKGVLLK